MSESGGCLGRMSIGRVLSRSRVNASAKLRWGGDADGLQLWTTLQPAPAVPRRVSLECHYRGARPRLPEPLFRGVERARHLNPFIGSRWPHFVQAEVNEWAAFSLLLQRT